MAFPACWDAPQSGCARRYRSITPCGLDGDVPRAVYLSTAAARWSMRPCRTVAVRGEIGKEPVARVPSARGVRDGERPWPCAAWRTTKGTVLPPTPDAPFMQRIEMRSIFGYTD